jgi:hypothetical protein
MREQVNVHGVDLERMAAALQESAASATPRQDAYEEQHEAGASRDEIGL